MMPVLGDIVKTLSGCGEYDEGWNWSKVSVGRVGEIIDGPSYAGWVRLRWEDGSESGKIWPHGFDTPTGHHPTLMNLSGQERMLIAAARVSALAQLRAENRELREASEAFAAVRCVDQYQFSGNSLLHHRRARTGQQDGIIGDHQADIAGEDS